MGDELLEERVGEVAIFTLNRPERANALNRDLHRAMADAWRRVRVDRSVRALVLTGAGTAAFCAGMDLRENVATGYRKPPGGSDRKFRMTPLQHEVWLPTVVAVNGVCSGAGLHFLADADVVVAADTASFLDTHVTVGQVFALEPLGLLPRIGVGNALRLAVLGRGGRLGAEEALRISLVDEVVPAHRLRARAVELAQFAAAGSPAAVEASKRAIWGGVHLPAQQAEAQAWELMLAHRDHPDAREGPRAFVEKRLPEWELVGPLPGGAG